MKTNKKDKNADKIDWSVLEEYWENDYNEVYAIKNR